MTAVQHDPTNDRLPWHIIVRGGNAVAGYMWLVNNVPHDGWEVSAGAGRFNFATEETAVMFQMVGLG